VANVRTGGGQVRAQRKSRSVASVGSGTLTDVGAPHDVTLDELADAYWENWLLADSTDRSERLRKDEVFWAFRMVECIVCGETWDDDWDADREGREPRAAPRIDRLALIEFLAERAPNEDALGFLGADALEDYLGHDPDVERVDEAARRDSRFRLALVNAWYDKKLAPQDVARLRRFGGRDGRELDKLDTPGV
jgi:hypothetical protein